MPHLRLYAVPEEAAVAASETLLPKLAEIVDCPLDYFTLQLINSTFYSAGKKVCGEPYIDVHWFAREQAVQDKFAACVQEFFLPYFSGQDITCVFTTLEGKDYYENGVHY